MLTATDFLEDSERQHSPDTVKLKMCLLFYDYLRDNIPSFSLNLSSEQQCYNTCSTSFDQLVIESFRTNLGKFCLSISGKYFRHNIPLSIPNKSSKNAFKKALKRYYATYY